MRALFTLLALILAASAPAGNAAGQERPRVVVVKTLTLEPFEVAESALIDELKADMDVRVLQVNLADSQPDAERLRELAPDVIVPIGTQAANWSLDHSEDVPVVFAMVLDPVSGGLLHARGEGRPRATGAVLDIPLAAQFRAMRQLLGAERVAVLYHPDRSGHIVREARREAGRLGMELVPIEVSDRTQFESALRQVDETFDALWAVPDTLVFSRRFAERILIYTTRRRIPLVGFSEQHVRAGALFSLVSSYAENGRHAAEIVRRVLDGTDVSRVPLRKPSELEIVFNARTAENLRVRLTRVSLARLRPVR